MATTASPPVADLHAVHPAPTTNRPPVADSPKVITALSTPSLPPDGATPPSARFDGASKPVDASYHKVLTPYNPLGRPHTRLEATQSLNDWIVANNYKILREQHPNMLPALDAYYEGNT